jgi:hypothetical protein
MPNDRPEFRPIEAAPSRTHLWPYAVLGAIIAGLVIWILRHDASAAQKPKEVALATIAPKAEPATAQPPVPLQPLVQSQPEVAKPKDTNIIGNAVNAVGKLATVAKAEFDREVGRTRAAQKQADAYKAQIATLEKQLNDARAQIAAMQRAHAPPPPSDQEQILQMLAPVLRTANDGRP